MPGAQSAILAALENLTPEEFKKFKLKLQCVSLRDGYGRIPRGTLFGMDPIDLSDKLVSFYLEGYATELTASVLCDMGMQRLAEQLQGDMSNGGRGAIPVAGSRRLQAAAQPAEHFVDRHRRALINRVTEVSGLLDALYDTVLQEGQYQQVMAERTNPDRMRRLYSFMPSWDQNCKDLLLQALKDIHPYLVADLERC